MRPVRFLVFTLVLVAILQTGCTSSGSSCSCAAGTTYNGTFYQQYANTSVRVDASLGMSDQDAETCCGDPEPRASIYSIKGIAPTIAIATKNMNGRVQFNVATGLPDHQQRIADRFAERHHEDPGG